MSRGISSELALEVQIVPQDLADRLGGIDRRFGVASTSAMKSGTAKRGRRTGLAAGDRRADFARLLRRLRRRLAGVLRGRAERYERERCGTARETEDRRMGLIVDIRN